MEQVSSFWNKYKYHIVVLVVVVGLLIVIKQQRDTISQQENISQSIIAMKQLQDGIVRDQSSFASKSDLEKFAKDVDLNLSPIKDDLKKLGGDVKGISVILATTPGFSGKDLNSTSIRPRPDTVPITVPCPNGGMVDCSSLDRYGYFKNSQTLSLNEPLDGSSLPFGSVTFNAWKEHPWDLEIYPRRYGVVTVLGESEDGQHYVYNRFTIEANGKQYPLKISEAKFVEEHPEAKFHISPRLYLGLDIGAKLNPLAPEVTPNLEVAIFSYGQTKQSSSWTFVGIGAGYESQAKTISFMLTPAAYNIGKHLPLMNNLYLGPSISVDAQGEFSILAGFHAGL